MLFGHQVNARVIVFLEARYLHGDFVGSRHQAWNGIETVRFRFAIGMCASGRVRHGHRHPRHCGARLIHHAAVYRGSVLLRIRFHRYAQED